MLSDTDTLSFAKNNLLNTFREVERNGKTWLVVNGVPLKETILNGRFMPFEQFAANPSDWNDVPVVLRHPKQNGGSARVPSSDVPVVGRFYNAQIDEQAKRLVGEFWLDKAMIENMQEGDTLLSLIDNQRPIEVSTGYWSETVPQEGKWNEKAYQYIDQNIHPDHIALLPDEVGACSVKDGCGLNRNNREGSQHFHKNAAPGSLEQRSNDIYDTFYAMQRESENKVSVPVMSGEYYIEATFDDYIICKKEGQLYKVGYSYMDGKVEFVDVSEWTPVTKIERYVEIRKNVTGSLPNEGKKIYEAVYQQYKDKKMSDAEAAQRAWGAVKKSFYQDKDGNWHKKETKKNEEDDLVMQLFTSYVIKNQLAVKGEKV